MIILVPKSNKGCGFGIDAAVWKRSGRSRPEASTSVTPIQPDVRRVLTDFSTARCQLGCQIEAASRGQVHFPDHYSPRNRIA